MKRESDKYIDESAALVWNYAEDHREAWTERGMWRWYFGLVGEVVELGLAMLGQHRHCHEVDTITHELSQIGSITINWMRHDP